MILASTSLVETHPVVAVAIGFTLFLWIAAIGTRAQR